MDDNPFVCLELAESGPLSCGPCGCGELPQTTATAAANPPSLAACLNRICLPRLRLAAYFLFAFGSFICGLLGYTISFLNLQDAWVAYWMAITLAILVALACAIEGLVHGFAYRGWCGDQSRLNVHVAHLSSAQNATT